MWLCKMYPEKKTTQERKKAWQPQQCCARVRYFTTPHQIIIHEMFPTFCSCTHTFWIIRTNKIRKQNIYFFTSSEILIYCWFYIETRTVVDSSKTTQMLYYHIFHCFYATVRYRDVLFSLAPYSTYIHIFYAKMSTIFRTLCSFSAFTRPVEMIPLEYRIEKV